MTSGFAFDFEDEPPGCRACATGEPCDAMLKMRAEEARRFETLRAGFNTERNRKRFAGVKRSIREHLGIRR